MGFDCREGKDQDPKPELETVINKMTNHEKNLTVLTCSFNSTSLLKNWFFSLSRAFENSMPELLVCENSTEQKILEENILFMDRHDIPYVINEGKNKRHATGVRMLIPMVETKFVLLVDTDTEILKDPVDLIEKMKNDEMIAAVGYYGKRCINHVNRIYPWYVLFNVNIAQREQFYFNCENTDDQKFEPLFATNRRKVYDVGCRFFEEIEFRGYKILPINKACKDYNDTPWYRHYEGLSWCHKRNDPLLLRRQEVLKEIEGRKHEQDIVQ